MTDEHSDRPFFKDASYVYSTGELVENNADILKQPTSFFGPNIEVENVPKSS